MINLVQGNSRETAEIPHKQTLSTRYPNGRLGPVLRPNQQLPMVRLSWQGSFYRVSTFCLLASRPSSLILYSRGIMIISSTSLLTPHPHGGKGSGPVSGGLDSTLGDPCGHEAGDRGEGRHVP